MNPLTAGQTIAVIVACVVVAVVTIVVTLVKVLKPAPVKANGNGRDQQLYDLLKEQVVVSREIRDGVYALKSDQRMASLEQAHLQKTAEALHTRIDKIEGTVQDTHRAVVALAGSAGVATQ